MGNLVIFVVGLLNSWLVKVAETFTDILNYYVLQTTANKFAMYVKLYVVKKYLKFDHGIALWLPIDPRKCFDFDSVKNRLFWNEYACSKPKYYCENAQGMCAL